MLEQLHRDPTLRVASHGPILLAAWRDAPTDEQMRTIGRLMRAFARSQQNMHALWNAILSGTPSFSEGVRRELNAQTADPSMQGQATAHVVLVDGFKGAATRGFLAAAALATRPKTPTKVFGEVAPAAQWVAQRIATAAGAPDAARIEKLHALLIE